MDVIILLPILIPLLAGVILYFVKKLTTAKALGIYSAVVAALALFAMLLQETWGICHFGLSICSTGFPFTFI